MIDQTVPLRELTTGMARCVRDWILPNLQDPMARTQAETLMALLEALPGALTTESLQTILVDTEEARDMLRGLGEKIDVGNGVRTVDEAVAENSRVKRRLVEHAADLRWQSDKKRQRELQEFFLRSMQRELEMVRRGTDFAAMTSREDAAREH